MKILNPLSGILCAAALALPMNLPAADGIVTGAISADPPTICCLGFALPIISGDDNYNASVQVDYRPSGTATWQPALPMLRVRPETISTETTPSEVGLPGPDEEFAGSIFGLLPDTQYEVRFTLTDPDGGGATQTLSAATRPIPLRSPTPQRTVPVAGTQGLVSALANAQPGDLISLAAGTYVGSFSLEQSGTENNPIMVRGISRDSVVIDAFGESRGLELSGDHIHLDNLTIRGSTDGLTASGIDGLVMRNIRITDVDNGVILRNSTNRNAYICDNVLEGRLDWPEVGTSGSEGILVTGQGHVVCHNSLSGFGDALGLSAQSSIRNLAIDFYGNDILWTKDDGIELDYAQRNVRAFNNRVTNANMGVSLQPVFGGPIYTFKNAFVNLAAIAYKFNNEPTGFYVYNNTSIRTLATASADKFGNYQGYALGIPGYPMNGHRNYVSNLHFKNNILVGINGPARVGSNFRLAEIDYNGWSPAGEFIFYDVGTDTDVTYASLGQLQAHTAYETNGFILNEPIFKTPPNMPPDNSTRIDPVDVTLHTNSNAIDAALLLPNINSAYRGLGPDLGAWESGEPIPVYGVRPSDASVPPAAPQNLRVE